MKKNQNQLTRIRLIDWQSFILTLGLVILLGGAMAGIYFLKWDGGLFGSILSIAIALIFCTLIIDLGFILTSGITLGEGTVNAGKNETGQVMIFHANKVVRVEVRDLACHPLTEDKKVYRRVKLTFIMESGRAHERKVNRLTAKKLARVRAAVEAEAKKST